MMGCHFSHIFVLLIFFATAASSLGITRCQAPYNDSYTCPRPSDPPERIECCLMNNRPACCVPGGSSCSDSADKRNYCPRPGDASERTHCCVWDSQPTCCLPGGSSCIEDDYADTRNYCPGPGDAQNDQKCCEGDDDKPACCRDSASNAYVVWYFNCVELILLALIIIGFGCCAGYGKVTECCRGHKMSKSIK